MTSRGLNKAMQSVFQWQRLREAQYQHVTFDQTHAVWRDEKWK